MTTTNPPITLYSIYGTPLADGWLMSDWAAGQTSIMNWEDQNVRTSADGDIELVLCAAPAGSSRPFIGGEIQSAEVATTGTWSWTAQAPDMVDGAVFGMFTYRADWQNQPWVEFDFEFVGSDTTKVQLNIHMEDASGRHISLDQKKGGPIIVDLGFDASQGMHTYDVTVSDNAATFRVDGKVVGHYTAADMPGGIWQIGPQKSYVDLWCAKGLESWTGTWNYDGTPLVAQVRGADVRPGDLSGLITAPIDPIDPPVTSPFEGDAADNTLTGGSGDDTIRGNDGNDSLAGGAGNDQLFGGNGNDRLLLDAGNDRLDGGPGTDWVEATGTAAVRIDLALTTAQSTGQGSDTILGIGNARGAGGHDHLSGTDLVNQLFGNGGNDTLVGRAGHDTLTGGAGDDSLQGDSGNDILQGEDGNDRIALSADNDLIDGGNGSDWLTVGTSAAATVNLGLTGAQATGHGTDTIRNMENILGNAGADSFTGTSAANHLRGMGGNDRLAGGGGTDTLEGGTGADRLYGGADTVRDVFVFTTPGDSPVGAGRDALFDFRSGIDDIDLRAIDANPALAGDQAFAFTGSSAAAHAVWTVKAGSALLLRADTNGDRIADMEIQIANLSGLTAGDLLL